MGGWWPGLSVVFIWSRIQSLWLNLRPLSWLSCWSSVLSSWTYKHQNLIVRTPDTLGSASSHISDRKLRKGSDKLETFYSSFPVCDKTFSWIVCVYCECRLELELVQIARKHWAVGHHPPHHHHTPHTIPLSHFYQQISLCLHWDLSCHKVRWIKLLS